MPRWLRITSTRARPIASQPAPDSYRELQHSLDRLGVDAARSVSTGAGVRVAVLDSAPQTDHPDLPPVRVAKIEGGPHGVGVHGTLTTGVIAAIADNGFGIAGVAPAAEVIAIPVCTPLGATPRDSCGLFDLLRGLDLAWKERAQVLNLSLVGPANPLLERAVNRLDDLGAIVVAAAGNEGVDEARYPAAYPSAVGVGAVDAERRAATRTATAVGRRRSGRRAPRCSPRFPGERSRSRAERASRPRTSRARSRS